MTHDGRVRGAWSAKRGWKRTSWSSAVALSTVLITWVGVAFNLIRFKIEY